MFGAQRVSECATMATMNLDGADLDAIVPDAAYTEDVDIDVAMRWLVAAELAKRLPFSWRLSEWSPKDGFYDTLLLHPHPLGEPLSIALSRGGQLVVLHGGDATTIAHNPWPAVAAGYESVRSLADRTMMTLERVAAGQGAEVTVGDGADDDGSNVQPGRGMVSLHVVRLLAELLRVSTLHGIACRVATPQYWIQLSEYAVAPTAATAEAVTVVEGMLAPFPRTAGLVQSKTNDPGQCWLVSFDGGGSWDAAITWSFVEFPGGRQVPLSPIVADVAERPWQYVGPLFGALVRDIVRQRPGDPDAELPHRPLLGVPAALEAFNRKERGLLFQAITDSVDDAEAHGPSLRISAAWAARVTQATGWTVPLNAWMGIDYHLSWLHGALAWAAGQAWPGQPHNFPGTGDDPAAMLVTGNQEDADVLLCWVDAPGATRIVVIEAKAFTSWSNTQMTSKLSRLSKILHAAQSAGLVIEMKVVLASPRRHKHLQTADWPTFAIGPDSEPMWMELPVSGLRLMTERCGETGKPSAVATTWRISGPR